MLTVVEEQGTVSLRHFRPMQIPRLKRYFRQHRWLYALIGCPYPARRWTRQVNHLLDRLGPDAHVLDLGSGNHRRRSHVINLEIIATPQVDVIADGHTLPFRSESLDMIICEAVLEHVQQPERIIAEIWRVLKPDGYACVAVPFLQGFHASPHDYQRYTVPGLEYLMRDFTKLAGGPCAGPIVTLHWIGREWIGLLFSFGSLWLGKAISLLIGWITYPLVWLDPLTLRLPHAHILASAVYFIGRKTSLKNGD